MNDNRNQQQQDQQSGEQNPTLNRPGVKVPDYGNTTGGSAAEGRQQHRRQGNEQEQRQDESIPLGNDETIGNP